MDFFGTRKSSEAAMIWCQCCALVFVARTIVDPRHVLNLTMSWIVDGTRCSKEIVDRPSRILCFAGYQITKSSIVLVIRSLSS